MAVDKRLKYQKLIGFSNSLLKTINTNNFVSFHHELKRCVEYLESIDSESRLARDLRQSLQYEFSQTTLYKTDKITDDFRRGLRRYSPVESIKRYARDNFYQDS